MENKDQQNSVMFEAPSAESFENEEKRFHVMPEKFLPKQKSGGGKKLIITIIVVLVAIVIGVGGFLLYQSLNEDNNVVLANVNLNTNLNSNLNSNVNTNANVNLNTNSNSNSNSNSNTNLNANGNINSNSNSNLNTNKNTNTNTAIDFDFGLKTQVPDSVDSDSDGLTDKEEILFGTDEDLPDTDLDTFLDGEEVKVGYNPAGEGKLVDTTLVDVFENDIYNYELIFPADWVSQALSDKYTEVVLISPSGELVEILVLDNPRLLSAKSWYLNQVPKSSSSDLTAVTVAGLSGVKTIDGFSYFIAQGDKIFSLVHDSGTQKEIDFRTVFEMIVNSFKFVEAVANEN